MDTEKYQQVLRYFENEGVTLPTDVKNSIEDVFMENDNVEGVQCYYRDEIDSFQADLTLNNSIDIYTNGTSIGSVYLTFTYHGQIDISLSKETRLISRENNIDSLVEEITHEENENPSMVYDPNEYNIILVEALTWNAPGEPTRRSQLYIYCPDLVSTEEEDNAND